MLGAGRAPPGMERVSQGNVAMLTILLKASAACDGGTGTWFSVKPILKAEPALHPGSGIGSMETADLDILGLDYLFGCLH